MKKKFFFDRKEKKLQMDSGAGKTKSQGKADRRQRAGRIHQGLCRNSKTDRRKYEEVRTLESNCDISDHL